MGGWASLLRVWSFCFFWSGFYWVCLISGSRVGVLVFVGWGVWFWGFLGAQLWFSVVYGCWVVCFFKEVLLMLLFCMIKGFVDLVVLVVSRWSSGEVVGLGVMMGVTIVYGFIIMMLEVEYLQFLLGISWYEFNIYVICV